MSIKKDFIDKSVKIIHKMRPKYNKDDIERIVTRVVKEHIKDPTINMSNSVKHENFNISLTKLCDWINKKKPVISGNATFYCQPDVLESPTSNMLRSLKKGRKEVKVVMYKYKAGSDEYQSLDLDQQNKKVIMNAEYGGSGTPTAAFYTKEGPSATTLMAQSIITTMAAFFESYVGDNQKFFSISECYDWMNKVIEKDDEIPKWVVRPSAQDVIKRITSHFYIYDIDDHPYLTQFIENCNDDELCYLYYANNLKEFISSHQCIIDYIYNILSKLPLLHAEEKVVPAEYRNRFFDDEDGEGIVKYNKWVSKEMFLDPYSIPDCISDEINKLRKYFGQFVFVEYITPDSIVKLNNHLRNTVLLVDTDSNIINADLFVSFITKKIFPKETFNRPMIYNEMILVNVLASMLDPSVAKLLDYYGRMHNMNAEARAELTMKNEFMFRRFFLMKTKKRYAASIVLREGNIILPFKLEIKGMDFIKAGVTDEVTKKFTKMLEDHILFSEDLELHELMRDLRRFENEIYDNLKMGGMTYLKQQQFKAMEAYSKPWSIQVFKGTTVWNLLYPDNKINSLDRVNILKLIVSKPEDLDIIKNEYPKEYNTVLDKIYNSEIPELRKAGFKLIAIPNNVKKIPDWLIPLVDRDIIVSDVISSFRSILDALNIEEVYFKTPNGNASLNSCLIAL